jgi:putative serine protease PepD
VVSIESSGAGSQDQGTGMIISADGLVLTNNHVIANAASGGTITVTQSGQTVKEPAALIGRDPGNDVALIQIVNARNLQPVVFAKSRFVEVGTSVVAIGNALGLAAGTPTVTSGIVSALGRAVDASNGSGGSVESLTNMIQTDAAINPGNSGGPLLNARGEVIGMNTAVAGSTSDGTSAQNIGFAIPSDHLTDLLAKLQQGGTAVETKAFLGVYLLTMTPQLQQQYGFKTSKGAVIADVNPGSPAEAANLQQGDVIVEANGQAVDTADDLSSIIIGLHPGDKLRLKYVEDGKTLTTTATLGTKA